MYKDLGTVDPVQKDVLVAKLRRAGYRVEGVRDELNVIELEGHVTFRVARLIPVGGSGFGYTFSVRQRESETANFIGNTPEHLESLYREVV